MAIAQKFKSLRKSEGGSISVLTIGLFLITIALLFLITDIATITLARQSLTHATESAALRAVQNLDLASYYSGQSNVAIPIDCSSAQTRAVEELGLWMESSASLRRPEIDSVALSSFHCLDNVVQLHTTAHAILPFHLPRSSMTTFQIHASAQARSDRALQ